MELLDKITKKASETYKGAAEKTSKIAREAKLKMKINENKAKINNIYQEMGKKVYQKHTSEEEVCVKKDLEEECNEIDILSAEIDTYHEEILRLSDIKICPNCKEQIEMDFCFCPRCGEKQPEIKEEEVKEAEVVEASEVEEENKADANNETIEAQEENSEEEKTEDDAQN